MPIIKILVCKKIDDLKNKIFYLACLSIFLIACSYTNSFASQSLSGIFSATQILHLSALLDPPSAKLVFNECDLTISTGTNEEQYQLGLRYFNDVDRDKFGIKAFKLFEAAAKQGHAEAQRMLGQCYEQGVGAIINAQKAKELLRLAELQTAADQNDAQAQYKLGCYYEAGTGGVEQNQVKARRLIELAADSELAEAQYTLARYFQNGIGGPKNLEEAEGLLQAATEKEQESVTIQKVYKLLQGIESAKIAEILEQFEKVDDDVQNYITKLKELEEIFAVGKSDKIKTEVDQALKKLSKIEDRSFYFDNYDFGQVIAGLIKIQRCKMRLRNKYTIEKYPNKKFIYRYVEQKTTMYDSSDELSVDPLYVKLQVTNTYTFNFVYTGYMQPLNGRIRRSKHGIDGKDIECKDIYAVSYPIKKNPTNEWEKKQLEKFLQDKTTQMILLAFEVARRKHEQDQHRDLPILCAISMALYLIEHNKEDYLLKKEFWAQDGKYYMFSGTKEKKERVIKEIIKLFLLYESRNESAESDAFKKTILDRVNRVINKSMQE